MIDTKEKLAGLLIPAFALRREQNDLGIGDTQAVMDAIDFCARHATAVLQLLPINETGGDNSPYNAISSVALDPVLLTMAPDMVPGLEKSTIDSLATSDIRAQISKGAVNYRVVKQLKFDMLSAAFATFSSRGSASEKKEFEAFKTSEAAWLSDYTLFRVLIEANHGNTAWPSWDERQRSPKAAATWLEQQDNAADLKRKRDVYAFIQWVAYKQWLQVRQHADKRGVRLMGDIPFGVSRYSADVWSNQELFDLDWAGGAPPEPFFQADEFTRKWGQNWGLPLYHWDAHRAQNFRWWHQRVHKCVEVFHYFRIDHVLGFFRIYSFPWVPERNGEFLPLSADEAKKRTGGRLPHFKPRSDEDGDDAKANAEEGKALLQMILDAAGKSGVVAEDLGMVPPYVRPLLREMGIPGFTIPYWEREEDQELKAKDTLPEVSLATYATHDHMPLVLLYQDMVKRWKGPEGDQGWLEMQRLMRFLGLNDQNPPTEYTPALHEAFLRALLETPCWLVVLMITELLSTTEYFNQPGTSGESNWSKRLDHPLTWFESNEPFKSGIELFARLVKDTRRLPVAGQVGTTR